MKTVRFSLALYGILVALFCVFDATVPLNTSVPYAQMVTDNEGQVLSAFLSADDKWRFKTELHEISGKLTQTLVYKEDRWFYWHPGINPVAIVRAAVNNITSNKRTSGASTISMQVVRLLHPRNRTFFNKCIETIEAFQLETHHTKAEILQLYCNLVSYGGNIEGIKAASVFFLNKTPAQLSLAEITTLMLIPNRPTTLRLGSNNSFVQQARNVWLRRMQAEGVFPESDIESALAEPLTAHRIETPRKAWHISVRLRSQTPSAHTITSTIRREIQERVQDLAMNHARRIAVLGINNVSVLVADNQTGDVLAYVGNPDVYTTEHNGQVDGVQAIRSPGSTLKPLVYGLAVDKGFLTPKRTIADVPVNYDGYSPLNFDKQFHGAVSMEQALAQSLNIPAVTTLHTLGIEPFVDALSKTGFTTIHKKRHQLGLSAVLGGCGVRLEELVTLYMGFANNGVIRPLRYRSETISHTRKRTTILSPASAYVITECLLQLTRPDLPTGADAGINVPRVAWKTGTSYGRRDAWSIGYNGRYTIGIWCGNFTGKGSPDLTGSTIATPLLFDVFRAIDRGSETMWHIRPPTLDVRLVCSITGKLPADSCTNQIVDDALPGISKSEICDHLKEVFISADGKMSYCADCVPLTGYRRATYQNIPPALLSFYHTEHHNISVPPAHNPKCTRVSTEGAVTITAPTNTKEYVLENDVEQRLQLRCSVPADVQTVYWYVNDVFITSAPGAGYVFFTPPPGTLTITCVDDKGRSDEIEVHIRHW